MSNVSIVIPVVRPESAKKCIEAIKKNAGVSHETYEIVSMQDTENIGCPKMVKILIEKSKHDLVMFLGDDTIPQSGFLKEAIEIMNTFQNGWGVVGLNTDDLVGSNDRAHWMAHKEMLKYLDGEFFHTGYKHCYCDDELKEIADEMGRWLFAERSKIEHIHPINKKADYDEHYQKAYDNGSFDFDRDLFYRRRIQRRKKNEGMRLGIGWPITDQKIDLNFVIGYISMDKPDHELLLPKNMWRGANIDHVRNDIIKQALVMGLTHLWLTDTDQIYFDDDTLSKMIAHNKPIVSAPVHRRYPPFDPILFKHEGKEVIPIPYKELCETYKAEGTIEADVTGMGCVFFDMEVFLDIKSPWFKSPEYEEQGPGEDIYFWHKANKAGYKILTDCSIKVEHLSTMGVGWETYKLFNKFQRLEEMKNGK